MRLVLAGLRIGIVGGDRRVPFFLPSLLSAGARVYGVGMELLPDFPEVVRCELTQAVDECHALILPMQGCDQCCRVATAYGLVPIELACRKLSKKNLLVLSGLASVGLWEISRNNQWHLVEFAGDNELAILNSIPTAEGAIRLAQERAQITIHGSRALVVGIGRCGTSLALLLKNMGADVAVAARRRCELARAASLGLKPVMLNELEAALKDMDFVFNTVPHPVLGVDELTATGTDVVIIDIASAPGGIDFAAAQRLGKTAVLAPGIPGKFTPKTAGIILGRVLPRLIIENLPEVR